MAKAATEHNLRTLDDLQPDPENPRSITPEALAGLQESLASFGDLSGITWNRRTGQLVCGHQRLDALRQKYGKQLTLDPGQGVGATAVLRTKDGKGFPVRVVDWEPAKQRMANLAANNPHIAGEFTDAAQAQLAGLLAEEEELFKSLRLDELAVDVKLPDFVPGSEGEQGVLDHKNQVECPNCGKQFEPGA